MWHDTSGRLIIKLVFTILHTFWVDDAVYSCKCVLQVYLRDEPGSRALHPAGQQLQAGSSLARGQCQRGAVEETADGISGGDGEAARSGEHAACVIKPPISILPLSLKKLGLDGLHIIYMNYILYHHFLIWSIIIKVVNVVIFDI